MFWEEKRRELNNLLIKILHEVKYAYSFSIDDGMQLLIVNVFMVILFHCSSFFFPSKYFVLP